MSLARKVELLTMIEEAAAGNLESNFYESINLKEEATGQFVIDILVYSISVDEANPSLINVSYAAD